MLIKTKISKGLIDIKNAVYILAPHAWGRKIYGVPKVWLLESLKKGVRFKNILVNFEKKL